MLLITHQQLIRYTTQFEEACPHIAFPKKLLWKCTLTVSAFFFFFFLLAFPIMAGALVFLTLYGGYYVYIFFGLLRTLHVSRWKYSVFLGLLAMAAYGAAGMVHAGADLIIH